MREKKFWLKQIKDFTSLKPTEEFGQNEVNLDYILNQFGTGIRYWVCHLDDTLFNEMNQFKKYHQVEWENLLFDFDFLHRFGFNHWSDLSNYKESVGLLINATNRIEIKFGAKFLTRFNSIALMNHGTFFPIYKASFLDLEFETKPKTKTLILIQFETGLIGKYAIQSKNLLMDDIEFHCHQINGISFLAQILYGKQILTNFLNDSVIVSSKVLVD